MQKPDNQNQNQIHFASGLPVLNIINKNQNVNQRNRKQPRKCTNKSAAQAVTVASLSAGIVPPVNSDDIAGSLVQHHIAFPVDQSQGKDKNEVPDEAFDLQPFMEALSAAMDYFFKNIVAFFRQNSVYGQAQVTTDIILTRQPDLLPSSNNKYRWGKITMNDMKTLRHAYFSIKYRELLEAMQFI